MYTVHYNYQHFIKNTVILGSSCKRAYGKQFLIDRHCNMSAAQKCFA